ncbi:hypothetical protein N0M98_24685 [Paenibacillus doosanensis]|uniref:hypothetical protein n=1 Tax=Paenibacillus doosanensis TaxID=1229154 RepID=UPI0021806D2D|nr:hypothetical protein [Paenibacillus doosanensis]MCS7463324.1 hypothetical protein [Paenibacillus doosanensis]
MMTLRWKGIVLLAAVLLLGGCRGGEAAGGKLPPKEVQPPSSSEAPAPQTLEEELRQDTVKSVQVAQIPMGEIRRLPLLADRPDDKPIIAKLAEWLHSAVPGEPAAVDEKRYSEVRPHVQVGIEWADGRSAILEPVCTMELATNLTDCHEQEGFVRLYRGGAAEPETIVSPELAGWLNRDYRYETVGVLNDPNPRAEGVSAQGTLRLVPASEERVQQLGAPSCIGREDDYRIAGSYDLTFQPAGGESAAVRHFDDLSLIRPDLQPFAMKRVSFGSFEAFAFIPAYADCHGIEFYLFGVKDGQAFPFSFQIDGAVRPTFDIGPGRDFAVADGRLIVEGGISAGMDYPIRYTFQPDLQARTMQLVRQEEIKP